MILSPSLEVVKGKVFLAFNFSVSGDFRKKVLSRESHQIDGDNMSSFLDRLRSVERFIYRNSDMPSSWLLTNHIFHNNIAIEN